MKLTGKDFEFPGEDALVYSDSEASEDKTYKPFSQNDRCLSDNNRSSREAGVIKSQRPTSKDDAIVWVQDFKSSNEGGLKIDSGFSDHTDKNQNQNFAQMRDKRSTIAQKLDHFKPEHSFEDEKKVDTTDMAQAGSSMDGTKNDTRKVERERRPGDVFEEDLDHKIVTEESDDEFGANDRDDEEEDRDDLDDDEFCANDRDSESDDRVKG